MKFYEFSFLTKKGGEQWWKIHIEAANAKEAKQTMLHMWALDRALAPMHQFDVKSRVLRPDEEFLYHYFVRSSGR